MIKIDNSAHERFLSADGIRGVAVLIVLFIHASVMFFPSTYPNLDGSGRIGVWLFFVLSAFLLTNNFIKSGFNQGSIISYVTGRSIRILPLYLFSVAIYAAFNYLSKDEIIGLLLLDYPWAHLWTIAVEFKFYFILPFIAFIIGFFQKRNGLVGSLVVTILIIYIHQYFSPYYTIKASSTDAMGYISTFTLGIFTAFLVKHLNWENDKAKTKLAILSLIAMVISVPGMRHFLLGMPKNTYLWDKQVYFGFAWCVFMYCSITSKGLINHFMSNIFLRLIGRWSFSIYLIHWLIYTKISSIHPYSFTATAFAFFITLIVGALMFYIIERPCEHFRHKMMNIIKGA